MRKEFKFHDYQNLSHQEIVETLYEAIMEEHESAVREAEHRAQLKKINNNEQEPTP